MQIAAIHGVPPDGLSFTDRRPEGGCDVALISGTIQYLSDHYAVLTDYAQAASALVVNRCPLADTEVATVQKVRQFGSYPAWIFARDKIEAALAGLAACRCDGILRWIRYPMGPAASGIMGTRSMCIARP
ncbi:class I SAM-dependent methyltransferase [Sphingomonas psychrotolerans]|uniref:Uncharacterized protein n=1 Tax=Sphingomonas psychrotolerans TaxID=1327635 RepID=A0A2K8MAP0_9SPHN|nr:hypothetical protein [Sphingomonas psychrotolerans]ATY30933.1 hypothetical protein CVN68_02130 [Sphingomonas psychrotolerans]